MNERQPSRQRGYTSTVDRIYYTFLDSPVGAFLVAGTENALTMTSFSSGHRQRRPEPGWIADEGPLRTPLDEFEAYFAGEPVEFKSPVRLEGTAFQRSVWEALLTIPYGSTASYGEIAQSIGRPKAARAVGAANGANRLPVIVPCHRVLGSDRSLTGFGGGLEAKETLLRLERLEAAQLALI